LGGNVRFLFVRFHDQTPDLSIAIKSTLLLWIIAHFGVLASFFGSKFSECKTGGVCWAYPRQPDECERQTAIFFEICSRVSKASMPNKSKNDPVQPINSTEANPESA